MHCNFSFAGVGKAPTLMAGRSAAHRGKLKLAVAALEVQVRDKESTCQPASAQRSRSYS